MNGGKNTISQIFNGNRLLEVPFFQRSYVWDEPQWERLLTDMENVSKVGKPYFMGSVILKQQPTRISAKAGDIRTIVDGQQRLTTLQIFFKVLSLLKGATETAYFDRTFFLMTGGKAMLHNHNDEPMFDYVMNLRTLDDLSKKNDKISKAYTYFQKHINASSLDFLKIMNNIIFIGIDVDATEDEQQIFDTINSLGVTLTTAELLKNYFFNRDLPKYKMYWEDVFEIDEPTKAFWDTILTAGRYRRSLIDNFFFAYLQIAIQDISGLQTKGASITTVSANDKEEFSTMENLFNSYKNFIDKYNIDKTALLNDVKNYAVIFKDNIDTDIVNKELVPDAGKERMNELIFGLDNATLIPYFLYILKNQPNTVLRDELFDYIEKYIVRRIICKSSNKGYNNFFAATCISKKCLTKTAFEALTKGSTTVTSSTDMPLDIEVIGSFTNNVYYNRTATNILYLIESKKRTPSLHATALKGIKQYSLEHMMPKNWRTNWYTTPMTPADETKRDATLLLIGNLTIITQRLNSKISDEYWTKKLTGKTGTDGLLRYASGIEITEPYLRKLDWNETEINTRTSDLLNMVLTYWAI